MILTHISSLNVEKQEAGRDYSAQRNRIDSKFGCHPDIILLSFVFVCLLEECGTLWRFGVGMKLNDIGRN